MRALGPRVGKEHKDSRESHRRRQRGEGVGHVGLQKGQVGQTGALLLALGAQDALGDQIHAETKRIRVRGGTDWRDG